MGKKLIEIKCDINDTKMYDFTKFKTTQTFGDDIKNGAMTMCTAKDEQNELAQKLIEFNIYIEQRNPDTTKKNQTS